jgi:mRNA interferase YafQ
MARPKGKAETDPPPPLTPVPAAKFRKDLKTLAKRGKDIAKLEAVVATLCSRTPLTRAHNDHALKGAWVGYRDCHVEPDWVLLYRVVGDELHLARTGTHSDLLE